jgi:hypothetical protein
MKTKKLLLNIFIISLTMNFLSCDKIFNEDNDEENGKTDYTEAAKNRKHFFDNAFYDVPEGEIKKTYILDVKKENMNVIYYKTEADLTSTLVDTFYCYTSQPKLDSIKDYFINNFNTRYEDSVQRYVYLDVSYYRNEDLSKSKAITMKIFLMDTLYNLNQWNKVDENDKNRYAKLRDYIETDVYENAHKLNTYYTNAFQILGENSSNFKKYAKNHWSFEENNPFEFLYISTWLARLKESTRDDKYTYWILYKFTPLK